MTIECDDGISSLGYGDPGLRELRSSVTRAITPKLPAYPSIFLHPRPLLHSGGIISTRPADPVYSKTFTMLDPGEVREVS